MRVTPRLIRDEVKELPLWRHRDEVPASIEPREIRHLDPALTYVGGNVVHLVVWSLEQLVEQPEFGEDPQR